MRLFFRTTYYQEVLRKTEENAQGSMDNCLTQVLQQIISAYGWKAVLAELAQLSIDRGKHDNADLLLQVSYDLSRSR